MTLSLPLFVPRSSNFRFNTEFCQLERFSDDFTIVCRGTQSAEKGSRVAGAGCHLLENGEAAVGQRRGGFCVLCKVLVGLFNQSAAAGVTTLSEAVRKTHRQWTAEYNWRKNLEEMKVAFFPRFYFLPLQAIVDVTHYSNCQWRKYAKPHKEDFVPWQVSSFMKWWIQQDPVVMSLDFGSSPPKMRKFWFHQMKFYCFVQECDT